MAGQGYHIGLAKAFADKTEREFTLEMQAGVLVVDSMNSIAGSRRATHFCGGAGCILPKFTELRQLGTSIQAWDSQMEKSFIVDPMVDLRLFEAANRHIPEGDYKDGLRLHLIADNLYDVYVQGTVFDLTQQENDVVIHRASGKIMTGAEFRKEIYSLYPMLDQYCMNHAGVTEAEIMALKKNLFFLFPEAQAAFLDKYLNFKPELKWVDNKYFQLAEIEKLLDEIIAFCIQYIQYIHG